jgi:hypothetical protein
METAKRRLRKRINNDATEPTSHDRRNISLLSPGTIDVMPFTERFTGKTNQQENLREKFVQLRQQIHKSMKTEEEVRLKENPKPTEEELCMGAFREWLEPQVRAAIAEMYRKGYATQSSGFHGGDCEMQVVDGYFAIDEKTKAILRQMGVDALRGADIGLPKNKLITIIRFRAATPSMAAIKARWDAIAAALPEKSLPAGIRPICDRAEEFREEYAPGHASLDEARKAYFAYLRSLRR